MRRRQRRRLLIIAILMLIFFIATFSRGEAQPPDGFQQTVNDVWGYTP